MILPLKICPKSCSIVENWDLLASPTYVIFFEDVCTNTMGSFIIKKCRTRTRTKLNLNSTRIQPKLDSKIDLNPILIQTRSAHFWFKMVHCMAKCNRKKGSKATHHLAWGHLPRIKIAIERILCIRKNKSKSHLWTQNVINLINDAEATKQSLLH